MAKIYTEFEIKRINSLHLAVPGSIYEDSLGNLYIGTTNRNLLLSQKSSEISTSRIGDMLATTIEGVLETIDERLTIIENNYVTDEELLTAKNDIKCFATAMAMIL